MKNSAVNWRFEQMDGWTNGDVKILLEALQNGVCNVLPGVPWIKLHPVCGFWNAILPVLVSWLWIDVGYRFWCNNHDKKLFTRLVKSTAKWNEYTHICIWFRVPTVKSCSMYRFRFTTCFEVSNLIPRGFLPPAPQLQDPLNTPFFKWLVYFPLFPMLGWLATATPPASASAPPPPPLLASTFSTTPKYVAKNFSYKYTFIQCPNCRICEWHNIPKILGSR